MRMSLCTALAGLVLLHAGAAAAGKIRILTTTPDLAALARAVGGGEVEARAIARGDQNPHYIQAKPSFMRRVNRADLLVYNGLQLEIGWLPLLIQGGRNPRIAPGGPGLLDASRHIEILEVPKGEVDRSMGDIHPQGNPHYTLNPRNGLLVAGAIAARLQQLFPDKAAIFAANLEQFRAELLRRIEGWEQRARALKGLKLIAYHKQWEYLADWLGLEIVDYIEDKAGVPPSPHHISALVARMQQGKISLIIYANFVAPKAAEQVARKSGGQAVELPASVGGEKGIERYADLFEAIIGRLEGRGAGN